MAEIMEILGDFITSVERALTEIDPNWRHYTGLIICGTHSPHDTEELINKIRVARDYRIPYLGICYGHQLGAIEFARNVLGIEDATSEEFGKGTFVVKKRKELKVGLHDGETYWNNYEVVIDWQKPDYFFTSQFHPEYQSSKDKPHSLLVNFLDVCRRNFGKTI